jgi:hypothetical protein
MLLLEWDRPLRHRRGSARRLSGLEIYYDFDWRATFGHDKAVFPRGQSLSSLVQQDCPENKHPTLLLTSRTDVVARIEETGDRYIVIVPIYDYLRNAGADAASTYYARLSNTPLTKLSTLSDASFSTSELQSFLDRHLTREVLVEWAGTSSERLDLLRDIAGLAESSLPEHAVEVIHRLTTPHPQMITEIAAYLDRLDKSAGARELMGRLTQSEGGRAVAARVLGERLSERIADTRRQLDAYQALISSAGATETDVQSFLERNPWIVGLPYVGARARVEIPRGQIDFLLDRYDGFFDIMELKGPDDTIIVEPVATSSTERPPSASAYSLGPALAKALAQAHHYRAILERSRELGTQYGLADTRQPRIFVLVGRSSDLSESGREILRQLNLTLHRVEVIPYDLLGLRTRGLLENIETLLGDPPGYPLLSA